MVLLRNGYMSQLLFKQAESIRWLRVANKYLENQYEIKDSWGEGQIHKKDSYDEKFLTEFDFIYEIIKQTLIKE